MPAIGALATQTVVSILNGNTGLPFAISSLEQQEGVELPAIGAAQVMAQNIAFDMAERTAGVTYPAVYVYCEGVANQLKEKFRTFSGTAKMTMEIRVSHDRLSIPWAGTYSSILLLPPGCWTRIAEIGATACSTPGVMTWSSDR